MAQNIEGQRCFNGRPVCICLLVAGFVGAWNHEFPIRLTTAGQVTKSVWAGIEPPPIGLSHWAYTTRVLTTSGGLLLKDHVQTDENFFLKIETYFGFPHDSNYRAAKRKVYYIFGAWD